MSRSTEISVFRFCNELHHAFVVKIKRKEKSSKEEEKKKDNKHDLRLSDLSRNLKENLSSPVRSLSRSLTNDVEDALWRFWQTFCDAFSYWHFCLS